MQELEPTAPFLVVGLGNPGSEYEATPHNFGFLVVDELAQRMGVRARLHECQSLTARGQLADKAVWLAKPLTYMNVSGAAVAQLLRKQPLAGWLVVCDELDLPFGALRLREQGSAGSHNGLRSIVAAVGTTGFKRLRLGIGPPHPAMDRAEFVLSRWSPARAREALQVAATAADGVEEILRNGMAAAMTRFNGPREDNA
ncbi:MAG: aminoacyl-tRNA hydrolase [Terriglobales bacterium]